ncbi:BQ2448_48 [Microbotryum intermedium]|uniref:BQ2448_48 protein n=1 Tax=Microbotryum intermedium TaxID=269621 RepID=A0A238F4D7_9BASI|nr:BQ2448_48 [Microbotryum intermedium]
MQRQQLAPLAPFSSSATARAPPPRYRRFGDPRDRPPPPWNSSQQATTASSAASQFRIPSIPALPGMGGGGRSGQSSSSRGPAFGPGLLSRFRRPPAIVALGLGGGTIYYVANLERVERTGRLRFIDVTPEQEVEMGRQSYNEIMGQYKRQIVPSSDPTAQFVQGVVRRIVEANELHVHGGGGRASVKEWETHVIRDEQRNAFVLPGILPIAKDADGLAVILGHEIAHQVARHSAERMSSLKVLFGLSILLESLGIDPGISRVGLNLLMTLPNSRKNEVEADFIGLQLAAAACYDPRAAEGLWQRMEAAEGGASSDGSGKKKGGINMDFLSTHPSSHRRVEKVREWAKEALKLRPDRCGPLKEYSTGFRRASGARW